MKLTSRFSSRIRTKSSEEVSKMTKCLAYIGVIALVVGVLLTTCVGSAWSMGLLTEEDLSQVRGSGCGTSEGFLCTHTANCGSSKVCGPVYKEGEWICEREFGSGVQPICWPAEQEDECPWTTEDCHKVWSGRAEWDDEEEEWTCPEGCTNLIFHTTVNAC